MQRPQAMKDLTIQEVFQCYKWFKSKWVKRRDVPLRAEEPKVIVRVWPRLSPNPEDLRYDEYCRIKVLLHHSFRSLDEFKRGQDTPPWEQIFAECTVRHANHPKDTLRDWENENRTCQEEEDDDELTNPDVQDMQEVDWQIWARDHPQANLPAYGLDTFGN